VLDGVRRALADDLDAPAALAVVDAWADKTLTKGDATTCRADLTHRPPTHRAPTHPTAATLVTQVVDALLGVRLSRAVDGAAHDVGGSPSWAV
jgi:L-cysteine:1D-myo-inositol 2-amino-2-deoxy-alpha-D-glucopyranoside ligase